MTEFDERNRAMVDAMASDMAFQSASRDWMIRSASHEYSYHFSWLGLPIIQYPQDMLAVQEILWAVKPRVVIETGIARGGSLIFSASILELVGGDGIVVGVDIDIREPSRAAIQSHPLARRITMIEGSSIDPEIVGTVAATAAARTPVVVLLDSNHTHDHVLRELELYSPLVTPGGYIVVFDTVIEEMPPGSYPERPWGLGNNPSTAIQTFLEGNDRFAIDHSIDQKLAITVARGGYLKCIGRTGA